MLINLKCNSIKMHNLSLIKDGEPFPIYGTFQYSAPRHWNNGDVYNFTKLHYPLIKIIQYVTSMMK